MSRRRCHGIDATGPEAAQKYATRHPARAGASSSLKKLDRATRIHNGARPLRYDVPTRSERLKATRTRVREERREAEERVALRRQVRAGGRL